MSGNENIASLIGTVVGRIASELIQHEQDGLITGWSLELSYNETEDRVEIQADISKVSPAEFIYVNARGPDDEQPS